jgi:putative transposase
LSIWSASSIGSPAECWLGDLAISMDAGFCIDALEEAIARYGEPAIFDTYQGSHLPARPLPVSYTEKIAISIDGLGCWRENVFVEPLWRW